MSTRKHLVAFGIIVLVIGAPFTLAHLLANTDHVGVQPLTIVQHLTAAIANFFGPWGVAIVRLVDFPNAGMRSFSFGLAIALTLAGVLLVVVAAKIRSRPAEIFVSICWSVFVAAWFIIGFQQIADGLL